MKSEERDSKYDRESTVYVVAGAVVSLFAIYSGLRAWEVTSSGSLRALYFGIEWFFWFGSILCVLVGVPLLWAGLRHFTRPMKHGPDG